jgi:hypothetical protein
MKFRAPFQQLIPCLYEAVLLFADGKTPGPPSNDPIVGFKNRTPEHIK